MVEIILPTWFLWVLIVLLVASTLLSGVKIWLIYTAGRDTAAAQEKEALK